jgi:hypothetical protein
VNELHYKCLRDRERRICTRLLAGSSFRHTDDSALHPVQSLEGVKKRLGIMSDFVTSVRKQTPFAVLGLGGALTILWIVLLVWAPAHLIFSMIAGALRVISFI